ncbi:MAG: M6 family metalloprotease domain-containing protein [Gemmatimonadetes bacterium]|nr:MAG: M6 family metalloprotease domain-containing protein [Gemmatimonadota bacterium]
MRYIGLLLILILFGNVTHVQAVPPAPGVSLDGYRPARPSSGTPILNPQKMHSSQPYSAIDTLHFVAIRLEFQPDNDPNTSGDGTFDLSGNNPDQRPHDYAFYDFLCNTQMHAYYRQVSYGQLELQADIFPPENSGSQGYRMSQPMGYYGANIADGGDDMARITGLFQEAIQAADADVDFSRYDAVVLIHAGVGAESGANDNGAPIPGNIWSQFLDFKTVREHLANDDPEYPGIATNDGVYVREAVLAPETEHYEPYSVAGTLGLLGVYVHEFGHFLGFVDLYNTSDGQSSGIGSWGLMGHGVWNGLGFFPAHPCAYNRANLRIKGVEKSWIDVREITRDQNEVELYQITAPHPERGRGEAVKVPLNNTEYFLIENRQGDPDHNGNYNSGFEGVFFTDYDQVEFDYRTPNRFTDAQGNSIPPPGGLLIMHVDEARIEARLEDNTLQQAGSHAIDVEEADGLNRLDRPPLVTGGVGDSTNLFRAPWSPEFTPDTTPSTDTNSGGRSPVQLLNISESDSIMTFGVSFGTQPGWPKAVSDPHVDAITPLVVDLDGDGWTEIITATVRDTLIETPDSSYTTQFGGLALYYPTGERFWSIDLREARITGPIAAGDLDGDGVMEIVAGDDAGQIHSRTVYGQKRGNFPQLSAAIHAAPTLADVNGDGTLDIIIGTMQINEGSSNPPPNLYVFNADGSVQWSKIHDLPVEASPAVDDIDQDGFPEILVADWNGDLTCYAHDGQVQWQIDFGETWLKSSPAIGNLDRTTPELEIVLPDGEGYIYALTATGEVLPGFPVNAHAPVTASPALGDLDGDGYLEIIIPNQSDAYHTEVLAINHSGSIVQHWYVNLVPQNFDAYWAGIRSSPALADVNGDGAPEVLVGTPDGRLFAWNGRGETVDPFPQGTARGINSTPAIADIDQDGDIEVIAASDDGLIYIWDVKQPYDPQTVVWGMFQANPQRTGSSAVNKHLGAENPRLAGSSGLIPAGSVYAYPNPTNYLRGDFTKIRYYLNADATVSIQIFDMAGDRVFTANQPGVGNEDNEIEWDVSNVASGVYFCRIEATSETGRQTEIIKIAVLR